MHQIGQVCMMQSSFILVQFFSVKCQIITQTPQKYRHANSCNNIIQSNFSQSFSGTLHITGLKSISFALCSFDYKNQFRFEGWFSLLLKAPPSCFTVGSNLIIHKYVGSWDYGTIGYTGDNPNFGAKSDFDSISIIQK